MKPLNFGQPGKEKNPKISEIESNLRASVERYSARVPELSSQSWKSRHAAGDNWALLGDAAGFVDPITDEGIYYALRSAELFVDACIKGDPCEYDKRWRADFGHDLRRASEVRKRLRFYGYLGSAPFAERMIQVASASTGVRRTLGNLVSGEQRYIGLKRDLALRALRIL